MSKDIKYIIGIDEAGRGPLAGPVSVGIVLVHRNFNWALIPGVNDSKKLSAKKREVIFERALELVAEGKLQYSVQMPTAKAIDKKGIAVVIRVAMDKGLTDVSQSAFLCEGRHFDKETVASTTPFKWSTVQIKLDGSLYAPEYCLHQETIIKGDAKEKVIGLASIMAKVTRDRYMEKIAKRPAFQVYNFARHKGYGTLAHRTAIAKHGLSSEHRASYCKNIRFL
jgi:ribonuclease HII